MNIRRVNRSIVATAVAGVLVSTYALYVEMAAEARPGYKALCDISEYASCSRVLTSEYSKGFGLLSNASEKSEVPNCIYGTIFYCIVIILSTFDHYLVTLLQLFFASTSVATSVYLAYLLAFVLRDFCVVCVSTYFINGALLVFTYKKNKMLIKKFK